MKISLAWLYAITKYGYPPSLENIYEVMDEVAQLGFRFFELEGVRERNLLEVYENREEILEAAESRGLRMINFCPVLPSIVSVDEKERERALVNFGKAVEIAEFFETGMVQIDSYVPPLTFRGEVPYKDAIGFGLDLKVEVDPIFRWGDFWDALVDTVGKCDEMAEHRGLRLCLEPRVGENVSNTDALLRLIDAVGSGNFGAVLDTGHLHAQKEILPLSVEKLADRIFYVHVSDNDGRDNYHLQLGKGNVDWRGVFTALKKHGFDGPVAVDIGGAGFPGDIDREVLESRIYLENLLRSLSVPFE